MKIAIDVRALQIGHEYRGIGHYLKNLLPFLLEIGSDDEFIILRYKSNDPLKNLGIKKSYLEVFDNLEILKKHKPDIFFQPEQNLGLLKSKAIKNIVVAYDLIPLVMRDEYLPEWKKVLVNPGESRKKKPNLAIKALLNFRKYQKGLNNLKKADRIVSISNATKGDLKRLLDIPDEKISVTHLGASSFENITSKMPYKFPSRKKNYLFFIGGVDNRRKIVDLVNAFNRLNARGFSIDLITAGNSLSDPEKIPNLEAREAIISSSYQHQIHTLGYVSDGEKKWLYENAFAFVFPSLYEGFGLPVLEAMALGCPVIAYKNSSLPEISGDAAILLNQQNEEGIFQAVVQLYESSFREKLVAEGLKQASKFNWDKCAILTYRSLLRKP
jgi:glycosyltransferase involved in cell wall biosynthesis